MEPKTYFKMERQEKEEVEGGNEYDKSEMKRQKHLEEK
jgi:hypothetical protein